MDIDLLSRMVGELIVGHDQVGLPGVGTFVAEMVPASFSDKGYTIHPPYRRLSFYPSRLEDSLLIDLYASSNLISREAAKAYITEYLSELRSVLEERKSIVFPGLGRLRATRENNFFFVPDEDLDIFPDGIGLQSVSLKSHSLQTEPVVIDLPVPAIAPGPEPVPAPDPEPESPADPAPLVPEPRTEKPVESATAPAQTPKPVPVRKKRDWRAVKTVLKVLLITLIAAAAVLGLFLLLSRIAPNFIDSLLYTREELRILRS
ncbi:MAG: hypothetical protein IKX62_06270 [Bacteroidales bacterium]|nr:hypothetical protein [Bacteroidales bacterium]